MSPRISASDRDKVLNVTRKKILDAAAVEFALNGFVGANINRISTAAGFAKGTVYNYFPSKRELMMALIDEVAARHTRFILQQVQEVKDPVLRLKQLFKAGFQFAERFPSHMQIAISVVFGHDPGFKERFYQVYENFFMYIIEEIVENGIEQKAFKPVDPGTSVALIMSLYLGNVSQRDSDGKIQFEPEEVVSFVMQGIQY
jgi:AcrR family transcriptional regulator